MHLKHLMIGLSGTVPGLDSVPQAEHTGKRCSPGSTWSHCAGFRGAAWGSLLTSWVSRGLGFNYARGYARAACLSWFTTRRAGHPLLGRH